MVKNIKDRDGIFFRVKRSGKYSNVCFSDLEEKEMHEVMQKKDEHWIKSLIAALVDNPFMMPLSDIAVRQMTCGNLDSLKNCAIAMGNKIYDNNIEISE